MQNKRNNKGLSNKLISRRLVLKLMCLSPLCWDQAYADSSNTQPQSLDNRKVLTAILDILIPRDSTPSATDLYLDQSLMDIATQIPRYPELIEQGIHWFSSTSTKSFNRPFTDLPINTQVRVIEASFNQPETTLPRVFIERLRDDVMTLYYHHDASWQGIGIEQPIQPIGYPKHNETPEKL